MARELPSLQLKRASNPSPQNVVDQGLLHCNSKRAMPWWPWSSQDEKDKKKVVKWTDSLNRTDWTHYTDTRNLVPVILLTTTIIGSYAFYRSYLRRIPQASLIQPGFWRKRSLFGKVTSVGDGDNFRLFHTPGGRLAGWGWLPGRRVPSERKELQDKTVCAVE